MTVTVIIIYSRSPREAREVSRSIVVLESEVQPSHQLSTKDQFMIHPGCKIETSEWPNLEALCLL